MHASPRDIVVFALIVSLIGTCALALSVLFRIDAGISDQTMSAFAGAGLIAFLYAALASLEVADRRAIMEVVVAAVVVVPIVAIAVAVI